MRTAKPSIATLVLGVAALTILPAVQAQDTPAGGTGALHRQVQCPPHPSARGYANMVYDWDTGKAYLFGGADQLS